MRFCSVCGTQVADYENVCPCCGAVLQQGYNQMNQQGMQQGYYNQMNQQGMQQGYYNQMNQQGMQQGYYNQMNQQGYMPEQAQNYPQKQKKAIDKKKIIIPIVSVAVVAIAVVAVWLIFFAGKLTKRTAKKTLENYAMQIQQKDVKGVLFSTMPRELLIRLFDDYGEDEYGNAYDFATFEDDLDDALDSYEVQNVLDNAHIQITNIEVKNVDKFKLSDYIQYWNGQMKKAGVDATVEKALLEDNGWTVETVESKFNTALTMYNIDPNDIYMVDLSFNIGIELEAYGESISEKYNSSELYADRAIIYRYKDQWYVIPPIEGALLPSMDAYIRKSWKSKDVSSAKTIKTAVETALGNENIYMEMTENYCDQLIYVTEEGLGKLPPQVAEEIKGNLGYSDSDSALPTVKYTENGAKYFAFEVTSDSWVRVYVVGDNESVDIWELCPDLDYDYY